eukprot:15339789-Ditylum_brightwellii.AAC.1
MSALCKNSRKQRPSLKVAESTSTKENICLPVHQYYHPIDATEYNDQFIIDMFVSPKLCQRQGNKLKGVMLPPKAVLGSRDQHDVIQRYKDIDIPNPYLASSIETEFPCIGIGISTILSSKIDGNNKDTVVTGWKHLCTEGWITRARLSSPEHDKWNYLHQITGAVMAGGVNEESVQWL